MKIINNYKEENNFVSREIAENKIVNFVLSINEKNDYHERLEKIKEKFSNAYESWKIEEDDQLKKLYSENYPIDEIAQILGRQSSAIRSRLKKTGILN